MTITQDLSFLSLITHASIIVQLIMLLLLGISVSSWTYIFNKFFAVRRARKDTILFEQLFWSGGNLNTLYQNATNKHPHQTQSAALERIFTAGMGEYLKAKASYNNKEQDNGAIIDGARRAMRAAYQREMDNLESHLAFLASVGSVSPYVGLFGTVWGIMNAFRSLANVQQATLAAVAPGMAEALIATAIGLFAAIPAVVAYNRYSHDIDRLSIRFESFIEEFSNILQRQSN